MRTLDKNWLAQNPSEEAADLTMNIEIPKGEQDVVDNPDGTRPTVEVKATGPFYLDVLQAMTSIRDTEDIFVEIAFDAAATHVTEYLGQPAEGLEDLGENEFLKLAEQVTSTWNVYPFGLTFVRADSEEKVEVSFEVKAPAPRIAMQAFSALTTPARMTQLAIALCPEVEDDYDDYDDSVLVVD